MPRYVLNVNEYYEHLKNNSCTDRVTIVQEGPTCWFNSLMTSLLYSDGMRNIVLANMPKWSKSTTHARIAKIITHYFTHENPQRPEITYKKAMSALRPERLLENLHLENPSQFEFNPRAMEGYMSELYLHKLLHYLHINDFLILQTNKSERQLHYSFYNGIERVKPNGERKTIYFEKPEPHEVNAALSRTPKVLIVIQDLNTPPPAYYATYETFEAMPIITYRDRKYRADSMMLSNFNTDECAVGHSIAGITCKGERYLYNGWTRDTNDVHNKNKKILAKVPCSFIKHDWLDKSKGEFCLDESTCFIKYKKQQNSQPVKKKKAEADVCFSYNKGPRSYIYIRVDDDDEPNPVASGKFVGRKHHAVKDKNKKKTSKDIPCPPEKILNPVTGRCVNTDGKIGKQLLKEGGIIKTPDKKKDRSQAKCPPEKILNPATGRCVKKDGKIGRKL